VRVTNTAGTANSNTATITIGVTPPTITTQPQSQTIGSGQTATLSVTAAGTGPLSYQWFTGSSPTTTNPISGATASSFTTPALTSTTSYWVRVTNAAGTANSNTATVTVTQVGVSDSFEGSSISSAWTLTQQNGIIRLSSEVRHSGSQSVSLTTTGSGQRNIWLSRTFPRSRGTLTVWFFDSGPGLYAGLYANDSTLPQNDFSSNVTDFDALRYYWHGPALGEMPTQVPRTPGWHKLELQITSNGFRSLVDNVVTGFVAGNFTFDTVRILVSGPGGSGTFYFDDFSFVPE